MKTLSQHLCKTCHGTNNTTLKGFEICDCILLISKWTFHVKYFLKMKMIKKLIVLRPLLVKMLLIVIF